MKLIDRPRVDIRGVCFDNVSLGEAVDAIIAHAARRDTFSYVFTPNAEIVQACVKDKTDLLYEIINSAGLIIPDGSGVVKAAKLFGTPLKEKVPGVEVGEAVIARAAERNIPVYLLGGKPGTAELAVTRLSEKYGSVSVVGCRDGYFRKSGAESDDVIDAVGRSGCSILFVCLGAPAQERWIYENRDRLASAGISIALALGGSLDIYAGTAKRAPRIFLSLGLEWLYRLLKQPSRLIRMTALPRFWIGCRREASKRRRKRSE